MGKSESEIMTPWTPWKNRLGATRSDRIYVRRAWGWFPDREVCRTVKGWDLLKKHNILGTFPDQPLEQVLSKVDALLPLGVKHPIGPWRYLSVFCESCSKQIFMDRTPLPFGEISLSCPYCVTTFKTRDYDYPARELELLPGQRFAPHTPDPRYNFLKK